MKHLSMIRIVAIAYFLILAVVAALNYIPGVKDPAGLVFGIFELDPFDDLLHLGSALWALIAALVSVRAARIFLIGFGAAYFADGLLGLATGVGYLDLGIIRWGIQPFDLVFRILSNAPHLLLGGVALWSGLKVGRR